MRFADGVRHDVVFHKAVFVDESGTIRGIIGIVLEDGEE